MNTELDETQAICDLVNTNIDNAVTQIEAAANEAGELALQTDNSSDFSTALTAINTAVDTFRGDGSDPSLFGTDAVYTSSRMTLVKDALDNAQTLFDTDLADDDGGSAESMLFWLNDEDTEMVQATAQAIQTEISRANTLITEWNTTVQTLQAEINSFATEVSSRAAFSGAKSQAVSSIISTANTYLQAAQGFSTELQQKIAISGGYAQEVQMRLTELQQEYSWFDGRLKSLKEEYEMAFERMKPSQQTGAR